MAEKIKMNKLKKDPELYYYHNAKSEKLYAFRHRYYDSLGKRKEKTKQGFKSENEAYRALLEVKTQIVNGDVRQVSNANMTISEWLDIWLDSNKLYWKKSTLNNRTLVINKHIKPILGRYKLSELDRSTYTRKFINKMLETYQPKTVFNLHSIFKTAIHSAVANELITKNRFSNIPMPQCEQKDNFYTPEELTMFLKSVKATESMSNYTYILFLAYTGVRNGESLGLQWKHIDFKTKTITIECTRDQYGVRKPKTKRSYRTILIDDLLINQLKIYRKWCIEVRLSNGLSFDDETLVFIGPRSGNGLLANTLKRVLDNIAEKSNLKRITPHGLRHTHATILIKQRVPVITIAERLGNSAEMIYNVYGHSFNELEKESVQLFGEAISFD